MDIDELFTTWRYRHAQNGAADARQKNRHWRSSGHEYFVRDCCQTPYLGMDLHNISTLLISRSELPPLPDNLRKELGFYYTQK
ncbi:MAG: hypothetical protein R2825_11640 [Saprospiraceae bacterium]